MMKVLAATGSDWVRIGRIFPSLAAVVLCLAAPAVPAETRDVTPSSFLVSIRRQVDATPPEVFAALRQPGKWWNKEHTWSGDAANLSLDPVAGGCYCERWGINSVEHGRVIQYKQDALIRMRAELGPLQALAVAGMLEFSTVPEAGRTVVTVTYRVNGSPVSKLDELAGPVEHVLTDQIERFKRYVETGSPELDNLKSKATGHGQDPR
jgi:hypothetical protein